MRRDDRLRRTSDIERVRAGGKSWAHPLLVWVMGPRGAEAPSRFAVVVGRRVGKAVVRNRVKRRVREAVRGLRNELQHGYDVVLIARPPAAGASYSTMASAVTSLAERAGLRSRSSRPPAARPEGDPGQPKIESGH